MNKYIETTLTLSTIENGRIYFDAQDRAIFPPDSFGKRSPSEGVGKTIAIEVNGQVLETDIRLYSSTQISPRKSFKSHLKALNARVGDRVRLTHLEGRRYRLERIQDRQNRAV